MHETVRSSVPIEKDTVSSEQRIAEMAARVYFLDLGLNWEYLAGKKVLDIGAGKADFAKAAKRRGVDVISLDFIPGGMGEDGKAPSDIPYTLANFREGAPFPDESFDVLLARASVQSMVRGQKDLEAVIHEAKRLLRPNGTFHFGPGFVMPEPFRESLKDRWAAIIEKARNRNEFEEERAKLLKKLSLARLQNIEPNITLQAGNPARGNYADFYYLMRKDVLT